MPGLQGRFSTLVKAKISSVLDRAEDPAETLDYSYEKQLELLQQAKSGIVEMVTSKKRLQSAGGHTPRAGQRSSTGRRARRSRRATRISRARR